VGVSEGDARLPSRSGTPRLARSGTTLLRTRWVLLSGDRGTPARSSATRFAAEHPARGRAARWRRAEAVLVTNGSIEASLGDTIARTNSRAPALVMNGSVEASLGTVRIRVTRWDRVRLPVGMPDEAARAEVIKHVGTEGVWRDRLAQVTVRRSDHGWLSGGSGHEHPSTARIHEERTRVPEPSIPACLEASEDPAPTWARSSEATVVGRSSSSAAGSGGAGA